MRERSVPLLLVASDARAGGDRLPSGGYLIYDTLTGHRVGGWCVFTDLLLSIWGYNPEVRLSGGNPIALCEGAMIPVVFIQWHKLFRGR